MSYARITGGAAAAALVTALLALAPIANATPGVARTALSVHPATAVVKVHRRSYGHRHNRRRHVVDAPFAYVESGRRTVVEAPFTTVYVGRRGRYIRAPFVNLWLPY